MRFEGWNKRCYCSRQAQADHRIQCLHENPFLHGWHSVPGGVKPTCLTQHGHRVINPAIDDDDFAAHATAQVEFDNHQPRSSLLQHAIDYARTHGSAVLHC